MPFLKVVNDTAVAVNQGGKRKGAVCAYLETWHLDIEEFLELRKNTGDDRRRTHDMNTANWIPDLFMKRVMEDGDWTLFSPSDVPGPARQVRHAPSRTPTPRYEDKAARGEIKLFKKVPGGRPVAQDADDAVRDRASVDHVQGRLQRALAAAARRRGALVATCAPRSRSTPATTRSRSATSARSTWPRTSTRRRARPRQAASRPSAPRCGCSTTSSTSTTTRSTKARDSNLRHRPVGLGIMGFQDALHKLRVPYASRGGGGVRRPLDGGGLLPRLLGLDRARRGARPLLELPGLAVGPRHPAARHARPAAPTQRGGYVEVDRSATLDWDALRARIRQHGMRNSNCMAIAPTATISNIIGVAPSIEPTYQNLFVKSNLSGEFTVVNEYLVRDLKARGPVGRGDGHRPQVLRRLAARASTASPRT